MNQIQVIKKKANNWQGKNFGDCAELVKDVVSPKDSIEQKYLGLEHIDQESLRLNSTGVAEDIVSAKYRFKAGDILFGKLRPYFRKVVQPKFDGICSTDIWVVRAKLGIDQRFLFYWMASQEFVDIASRGSEGTKMPRAKWDFVSNIRKTIPSLSEQKAIADFLGALDDKIELNIKMNETLEQMAQAIFKSWFIDFAPVKANAQGKKPFGMDSKIAALFPDSFEDSPLGKIPKGWKVVRLGEVLIEIESGARPKGGVSTVRTEIPSIGAENIIGIGKYDYSKNKYVSKEFIGKHPKAVVKNGDVLVYKDGASLGRKSYFDHNFPFRICAINEHVFRLRVNKQLSQLFLYFWLDQPSVTQQIIDLNSGSAQPGINKQSMRSLKILLPPKDIVDRYEKLVGPYTELLLNNCKENQVLANLRDSLLPKLLSGEIRIKA